MYKSFKKEYERLSKEDRIKLCEFWQSPDNDEAIFKSINENFSNKLSELTRNEAKVLYEFIISKEEPILERQITKNTGIKDEDLFTALSGLMKKAFIYNRKTIAKLTSGHDKYFLYKHVRILIDEVNIITDISSITNLLDKGYLYLKTNNTKLFNTFFIENGIIEANSPLIIELRKNNSDFDNWVSFSLYFNNGVFLPIYHINPQILFSTEPVKTEYSGKGLFFLNALSEFCYTLKTKKVLLNRNEELCKYDRDLINNIFRDEEVASFFLSVSNKLGLIESDGKTINATPGFISFIHKNINEIISIILNLDDEINNLFKNFLRKEREFSLFDVYRFSGINGIYNHKAEIYIKILYYLGIINKSENNTFITGLLYENFIKNQTFTDNDIKSFVVNNNFTIIAETDKLTYPDEFILRTFFTLETDGKVKLFKMEKKAFLRGIFLGFDDKALINLLQNKSSKPVPEMIFTVISDWRKSYKKVEINNILVISGPKDVIDILFYHRELSKYITARHGDNIIEVLPEAQNFKFLEDEDIFISGEK